MPWRIPYGEDPDQFGELHLPDGPNPAPVVVVLHGGFWRHAYTLELGTPLAVDLAEHGVAAWNLEYRRVGGSADGAGGYPNTFTDVAAGIDALRALAGEHPIDPDRVVLVGHSAGGQLAVWAAARGKLPDWAPGANPQVRPAGVVAQAGVLDLTGEHAGGSAVHDLMGGAPDAVPERYAVSSPLALLPLGVPVTCVHGSTDDRVPLTQSEHYLAAASAAGDSVELVTGEFGHFELIDPRSQHWTSCREAALSLLRRSGQ